MLGDIATAVPAPRLLARRAAQGALRTAGKACAGRPDRTNGLRVAHRVPVAGSRREIRTQSAT